MQKQLTLAMLVMMGFGLTACVSKRQYANLETDLNQRLQATEQQRDQAQAALTKLRQRLQETGQRHDQVQTELTELNRRFQETGQQRDQYQAELSDLKSQYATLQTDAEKNQSLLALKQKLEQELKDQISNQTVKIETLEGQLKVTLVDKVLFESGSARINDQGRDTLRKVAESIRSDGDPMIRVEGHTDNVPISQALQPIFPTNWELSTARATAVVRFLQDPGDIVPKRLSASGYSYYQPVEPNDEEAGRRQNRRIEIVLATLPVRS